MAVTNHHTAQLALATPQKKHELSSTDLTPLQKKQQAFNDRQVNHANSNKKTLSNEEDARAKIEKDEQGFLKIMLAGIKNPSPEGKSENQGNIAQTMATFRSTKAIMSMSETIRELKEVLSTNNLAKAMPMVGKTVWYDTSTQTFDGKTPVKYAYQLKYDDISKPNNAHVSTLLTVYNSNGVQVYKTKGKDDKDEMHSFTWDGKDFMGKPCEEGDYSLVVESNFIHTDENGKQIQTPIRSGSFLEGYVDSAELENGRVKLSIDNIKIDLDDIIGVKDVTEAKKQYNISEYSNFIGKNAEVKDDAIIIKNQGKGIVKFNCEYDKPGEALIQILDSRGKQLGTSLLNNIRKGLNEISFVASDALTLDGAEKFNEGNSIYKPLNNGRYTCKVLVQNKSSSEPNKFNEVSLSREVKITGLDFSGEPLAVAGDEKINVESITRLVEGRSHETSLRNGIEYLGKVASVSFSKMKIGKKDAHKIHYSTINEPANGDKIIGAYMNVYDSNDKLVAKVNADKLITFSGKYILDLDRTNLYDFIKDEDKKYFQEIFEIPDNITSGYQFKEYFNTDYKHGSFEKQVGKAVEILINCFIDIKDKVNNTQFSDYLKNIGIEADINNKKPFIDEIITKYQDQNTPEADGAAAFLKDLNDEMQKAKIEWKDNPLELYTNLDKGLIYTIKEKQLRNEFEMDFKKLAQSLNINYEDLSEEEQNTCKEMLVENRPVTSFMWNLKDDHGKKVLPGEYKTELMLEKIKRGSESSEPEDEPLGNNSRYVIAEYTTDKGQIEFLGYELNNQGQRISNRQMSFTLEEIDSLAAF